MRLLNEKTVISLPTATRPDKEGYLYKRGVAYNKAFRKRYFVLVSNLLYYYERRGDREPLGLIILEGHMVQLYDDADRPHTFVIRYPDDTLRQYVLSADSGPEANSWMHSVMSAGVDYTRITVEELEAQLQRDSFQIPEMPEVTTLRSPEAGAMARRKNPFGDGRVGFRVTVHFPTFQHFHEAIEESLMAQAEPKEPPLRGAGPGAEDLIEL